MMSAKATRVVLGAAVVSAELVHRAFAELAEALQSLSPPFARDSAQQTRPDPVGAGSWNSDKPAAPSVELAPDGELGRLTGTGEISRPTTIEELGAALHAERAALLEYRAELRQVNSEYEVLLSRYEMVASEKSELVLADLNQGLVMIKLASDLVSLRNELAVAPEVRAAERAVADAALLWHALSDNEYSEHSEGVVAQLEIECQCLIAARASAAAPKDQPQ